MLSPSTGTRVTREPRPSQSIRNGVSFFFGLSFASGFSSLALSASGFSSSAFVSPSAFLSSNVTSSDCGGNGLLPSLRSVTAKIPVERLVAKFHSKPLICGAKSRSER